MPLEYEIGYFNVRLLTATKHYYYIRAGKYIYFTNEKVTRCVCYNTQTCGYISLSQEKVLLSLSVVKHRFSDIRFIGN